MQTNFTREATKEGLRADNLRPNGLELLADRADLRRLGVLDRLEVAL
jgi:hypothetical protein